MVLAEIHNPAISIQLGPNEQVTVPAGMVWKVNINCQEAIIPDAASGVEQYFLSVNDVIIASNEGSRRNSSWGKAYMSCSTLPLEGAVFVEGDTIRSHDGEMHINGFVVSVE